MKFSKLHLGLPTRGKTALNRLRRVDNFICAYEPSLFNNSFNCAVDLGYGRKHWTTHQMAEKIHKINPNFPIFGTENDKERVESVQSFSSEKIQFMFGGFDLSFLPLPVIYIRAFNVLRQYPESEVKNALVHIAKKVIPGGILIEGTSEPFGSIWTANVLRRLNEPADFPWKLEAMIFSTNFKKDLDLSLFQAVLPKNCIHKVEINGPVKEFFSTWNQGLKIHQSLKVLNVKQWLLESANHLKSSGFDVCVLKKWIYRGYLIWKNPPIHF